ncbi:MAG: hypothetical protein QW112_02280 [Candidatus Micrarchaeia archaeon]
MNPRTMVIITTAVFLLFLASSCIAATSAEIAEVKTEIGWSNWAVLIGVALLIGYAIAAMAYMLGNVFHLPTAIAWTKNEVKEINMSALLAVCIIICIAVIDNVYDAYVEPSTVGNTPLGVSTSFLSGKLSELLSVWKSSIGTELLLNTLSGPPPNLAGSMPAAGKSILETAGGTGISTYVASSEMTEKAPGMTIPAWVILFTFGDMSYLPFYGFQLFSMFAAQLSSFMLLAIATTLSYKVALSLVAAIALPVLVPFGIFLRCFTLTRKLGSTLIAIGVCLYIFLPMSILIMKGIVNTEFYPTTLPSKPKGLHLCGVDYDPGSLIEPFFGPDINCDRATYCLRCDSAPWDLLGGILKPLCRLLNLILWVFYLVLSLVLVIIWGVVTQLSCTGIGAGTIAAQILGGQQMLFTLPAVMNGTELLGNEVGNYTLDLTSYTASVVVPIVISPVITFIIIITAIRSVSAAIGGEVQILGISGMI